MKTLKRQLMLLACVGALLIVFAPSSPASELDKKTFITVNEPIQLPGGRVLQPGEYTMRVLGSPGDLKAVQFLNRRETKVYATVMTNSTERAIATGKTVIAFREARTGEPVAMDSWFYPGRTIGWQFPASRKGHVSKNPEIAQNLQVE